MCPVSEEQRNASEVELTIQNLLVTSIMSVPCQKTRFQRGQISFLCVKVAHQNYLQNTLSIKNPRKCRQNQPPHTLSRFEKNTKPGEVADRPDECAATQGPQQAGNQADRDLSQNQRITAWTRAQESPAPAFPGQKKKNSDFIKFCKMPSSAPG